MEEEEEEEDNGGHVFLTCGMVVCECNNMLLEDSCVTGHVPSFFSQRPCPGSATTQQPRLGALSSSPTSLEVAEGALITVLPGDRGREEEGAWEEEEGGGGRCNLLLFFQPLAVAAIWREEGEGIALYGVGGEEEGVACLPACLYQLSVANSTSRQTCLCNSCGGGVGEEEEGDYTS